MQEKYELIIVFKKTVSDEMAEEIIKSFNTPYREGMDSSKGKIYFYATGAKYILTFPDADAQHKFELQRHQFRTEIHQIYEPNWEIQKD